MSQKIKSITIAGQKFNVEQNSEIDLAGKADLVDGKVPAEQLPEPPAPEFAPKFIKTGTSFKYAIEGYTGATPVDYLMKDELPTAEDEGKGSLVLISVPRNNIVDFINDSIMKVTLYFDTGSGPNPLGLGEDLPEYNLAYFLGMSYLDDATEGIIVSVGNQFGIYYYEEEDVEKVKASFSEIKQDINTGATFDWYVLEKKL